MAQELPGLANMSLTPSLRAYQIDPPGMPRGAYLLQPTASSRIESLMEEALPAGFGDRAGFVAFLKGLLTIDPRERLTAEQALAHPWLAAAEAPGTTARDDSPLDVLAGPIAGPSK